MSWSYQIGQWLGIGVYYLIAAAMIAGGIYLAVFFNLAATNPVSWLLRPLRYVGYALVVAGVAFGYGTYRESVGASKCETAWQQKNLELQIANLRRDIAAQKAAAEAKADEARALAAQKADADAKLTEWQNYTATLEGSLAAGRRATGDDDRRMCDILGNAAAGCKPAR